MSLYHTLFLLFLPLVLSMQHFSVGVSNACAVDKLKPGVPLKTSIAFAISALMFFYAGYFLASLLQKRIDPDATAWIVFVLMGLTGFRMILHGWQKKSHLKVFEITHTSVVLALALALGVNMLFVGAALFFTEIHTMQFAFTLAAMILFFSFSGLHHGKQFGENMGWKLEIFSGFMVIAAGLSILRDLF